MRFFIVSIIALLAWTVSIQWIKVPTSGQSLAIRSCANQEVTRLVLWAMEKNLLNQIFNDGESLWVDVAPTWATLSDNEKQYLYNSLSCFAQQQDVSLRLVSSHDSDSRENTEWKTARS